MIFIFIRYRTGEWPGDDRILLPAEDRVRGDGRCGQLILRPIHQEYDGAVTLSQRLKQMFWSRTPPSLRDRT